MERKVEDLEFVRTGKILGYPLRTEDLTQKKYLTVEVEGKGERKEFSPHQILEMMLDLYFKDIDNVTDLKRRMVISQKAKRKALVLISQFKEELRHHDALPYDFTDIMNIINNTVDNVRWQLDFQKYDLEIKKYDLEVKKLDKEVHWHKDPKYWITVAVSSGIISAIVGLVVAYLVKR